MHSLSYGWLFTRVKFPWALNSSSSKSALEVLGYKKYCNVVGLWLGGDLKSLPQFSIIQVNQIIVFTCIHATPWIMNNSLVCAMIVFISILIMEECDIPIFFTMNYLFICSYGHEWLEGLCVCWYFHEF